MCWSPEISTGLAVAGIATTGYLALRREAPALWVTLGYFSIMEILQALSYPVIDNCGSSTNQWLTFLSYLHIAFQPFFFNLLAMHFIPESVRKRIQTRVYALCTLATVFLLVQLYPFDWAGVCAGHRAMCGPKMCTMWGNWHLAWELPLNGIGNNFADHWFWPLRLFPNGFITHALATTLLPLLYGSWKISIYLFLTGPVLVSFLTDNIDERPAIWCMLSIAIVFVVIKTPLRRFLRAKRWFCWPSQIR